MSDFVSIASPFADVASLAQGYMNRVDGERLLLPLPSAYEIGFDVRFVVLLEDGTPAFAGAGQCAQVSDRGGTVPPEQRFETLLQALRFDERSQPVYDYIVAVRGSAYAQEAPSDMDAGIDMESIPASPMEDARATAEENPLALQAPPIEDEESLLEIPSDVSADAGVYSGRPSFVPAPIPTGLLNRPARAARWQPAPPRRPTPRPISGLFRYQGGGLPLPAQPPRPDLDPSRQVRPAPRP